MSAHSAGLLRHALKQVVVTGTTGSLLIGGAVAALATGGAPAVSAGVAANSAVRPATSAPAAVELRTAPTASHTRKVNVPLEMKTAASLKGRPYRYGAAGPRAFDCSGYVQYVFKKQHWTLKRTAAAQYRQTRHVARSKSRVGDLIFFYGSGGVYHVGILAGHGYMWAAPHTGTVVHKQRIYGKNWKLGRVA